MNKEMKNSIKIITLLLVVFIILYLLHIALSDRFESQFKSRDRMEDLTIIFATDYQNKILTVEEIYPEDKSYYWSEIEIASGSATFDQYDVIEIGHTLSNCTGYIELEWIPSGTIVGYSDFR